MPRKIAGENANCPECGKAITDSTDAIQCDACDNWFCKKCINNAVPGSLPGKLYKKLFIEGEFSWVCHNCGGSPLPLQLLEQGNPRIADSADILIALGVEPTLLMPAAAPTAVPTTRAVTTIAVSVAPPHSEHGGFNVPSDGPFQPDQRQDSEEAQLHIRLQKLELENRVLKERLNREPPPSYPFPPVSTHTAPTVFTTAAPFPSQQVASPVPFCDVTTNAFASVGVTNTTTFSGANLYPSHTLAGGIFSTHPIAVSPPPSAPIFSPRTTGATPFQSSLPRYSAPPHSYPERRVNFSIPEQGPNPHRAFQDFREHLRDPQAPITGGYHFPVQSQQGPQGRHFGSGSFLEPSLPHPELPKFDGTPGTFEAWWEAFDCMVHSKPAPDVWKMRFLKQALKGSAAQKIEGLYLGIYYEEAIQILFANYGNRSEQKSQHWEALWSAKEVDSKWGNLEQFTDFVRAHVIALERLGTHEATLNESVGLLMKKLPESLQNKFAEMQLLRSESLHTDPSEQITMKQFLASLVKFRRFAPASTQRVSVSRRKGNEVLEEEQLPSTPGLLRKSSQPRQQQQQLQFRECIFCEKSHQGYCRKVTSPHERKEILQRKKRCFVCLSPNHAAKECRSNRSCSICHKRHHTSICFLLENKEARSSNKEFHNGRSNESLKPNSFRKKSEHNEQKQKGKSTKLAAMKDAEEDDSAEETDPPPPLDSSTTFLVGTKNHVVMPIISGFIVNPISGEKVKVNACLDTGASGTSCTAKVAEQISLAPTGSFSTMTACFANKESKLLKGTSYSFIFQGQNGAKLKMTADAIPHICPNFDVNPVKFPPAIKKALSEYKVINMPPNKKKKEISLDLLIGSDYYNLIMHAPGCSVACLEGSLRVHQTPFGGILSGAAEIKQVDSKKQLKLFSSKVMLFTKEDMRVTYEQENLGIKGSLELSDIPTIWSLDDVGIGNEPINPMKDYFCSLMSRVPVEWQNSNGEKSIVMRYQTKLPFKTQDRNIGTNFVPALKRLSMNLKRLCPSGKETPQLKEYNNIFQSQLVSGILEEVNPDEKADFIHYLSHFPVFREDSTFTKVRIVLDPTIKAKNGKCLNDLFYTGPNTMEDLCGLLLRSRTSRFLLVADVAKAFHQILIDPSERNALRILWLKNPNQPTVENNLKVLKHSALPFGLKCSPAILGTAIDCLLSESNSPIASKLLKRVYMDNCILSAESKEECSEIRSENKALFSSAGMNLREWASNNLDFNETIPEHDREKGKIIKVLGLKWDIEQDSYSVKTPPFEASEVVTKRSILRMTSQIFDPIGWISPITIRGRILLQQLWKEEKDWDEIVSEKHQNAWKSLLEDMTKISTLKFQRQAYFLEKGHAFLVAFCDASTAAFAVGIYLVQSEHADLLFAKAKVAPLKPFLTVPRLELTAVIAGCRALRFVETQLEIKISKKFLFNDSQIALHQIASDTNQLKDVWVRRRVNYIQSFKEIEIRYLPGTENVADLATRGLSFQEMQNSNWFQGPNWLKLEEWPFWPLPTNREKSEENEPEVYNLEKNNEQKEITLLARNKNKTVPTCGPFQIKDEDFSSLSQLFRITAWCFRFIDLLRKKHNIKAKWLLASELRNAKQHWCFAVQEQHYQEVKKALKQGKKTQLGTQLDLFLDESGIIRCGGRLINAPFPTEAIHPILLPKKSHFTFLVIKNIHCANFHYKTKQTLSMVRLEYWIPQGISAVNEVIKNCIVCRRISGTPFKP